MGILASKSPSAATSAPEKLYTAPNTSPVKRATVTINISNRDATDNTIRLWLSKQTTTPVDSELIETDTPVNAAGTKGNAMQIVSLTVDPGQTIYFGGSSTAISFNVHGYEELA